MTVITRFAPSPTGLLHCGNYRTAVFAYLFAKQKQGTFIVRIEDTDKERSKKEYEDNILESLEWLQLPWDALHRQSERATIHEKYLTDLVEKGLAYVSDESGKEGATRSSVIRFKNPNIDVTFHDLIRGSVTINTKDLGDFVIAKSITEPLFHLAVVVDDFEMGITHIIRGEDHISNTPRQILIQRAIGAETPEYAHLPIVLAKDKSKLSKRKGALPVSEYRNQGYLPEALLNYLTLLGWNPGTEQELFTKDELIQAFDLSRVQKHGAIFDEEKLRWFNQEHIKRLPIEAIRTYVDVTLSDATRSLPQWSQERLDRFVPVLLERIATFGDIRTLEQSGDIAYIFSAPEVLIEECSWKKGPLEIAKKHLTHALTLLEQQSTTWTSESLKAAIWDYATLHGRGEVLWPLRYALTGKEKSPDPFTTAYILGQKETLARIRGVLDRMG